MKHRTWKQHSLRLILRWVLRPVLLLFVIFATLILVGAFASRKKPALETWHRVVPEGEFTAADLEGGFTFAEYLALEDRLFKGLVRYQFDSGATAAQSPLLRYAAASSQNPANHAQNWNRSFEVVPEEIRGGALLIHGLTDSPYSMRAVADLLSQRGYYVLAMRMPGHGTAPAGLLACAWEDWVAAVEVGARHVQERAGASVPFYVVGYSNGGALAVHYTLQALDGEAGRVPDRLVLFSPAIGVTAFARIARWDKMYGFIPYFEQSKWLDILPEYDPYKYSSFPKNAGTLEWNLTRRVQARLQALDEAGRMGEFPPVLTFQSAVDATVKVEDLITQLYGRIESGESELVLFDVNRLGRVDDFIGAGHLAWLGPLAQNETLGYRLTIVTNVSDETKQVKASSKPPRSRSFDDEPLDLEWPPQVFSLAHLAMPFRPDDSIFGLEPRVREEFGIEIGAMSPRGEKGVLEVPASSFIRMRCNPFFAFAARRITEAVDTP
jgi:alpha-beta hydrolase superfamily lysophospholipase